MGLGLKNGDGYAHMMHRLSTQGYSDGKSDCLERALIHAWVRGVSALPPSSYPY